MRPRKPLPNTEIVAAYNAGGETHSSLARRYGVSREAIRLRLEEAGETFSKQRRRDITFLAEVMPMLAVGTGYDEIGSTLGMTGRAVRERIRNVCLRISGDRSQYPEPAEASPDSPPPRSTDR